MGVAHNNASLDHGLPRKKQPSKGDVKQQAAFLQRVDWKRMVRGTALTEEWSNTGANLAVAGPFFRSCEQTVRDVDSTMQEGREALCQLLFHGSCRPLHHNTTERLEPSSISFAKDNFGWELLGLYLVTLCRAIEATPSFWTLYHSREERCRVQREVLELSDHCLEICISFDCLTDLQVIFQYENFIAHSIIDGDQSESRSFADRLKGSLTVTGYQSWRRLGDVISSLYALGYHEQQNLSFDKPGSVIAFRE